jgi:CTP synthase
LPENISSFRTKDPEELFYNVDGILIPGGFGIRGIEGKIKAVQYAREKNIPFFGICLGMQVAVTEFARNVLGYKDANSTEFDPGTKYPVIHLLEEQRRTTEMGGTMRLGAYLCSLKKNTVAHQIYNRKKVQERHRHRYEFNNRFREKFSEKGMIFSGIYREKNLVEIVELKNHPWFIGVQFHPEFKSKPDRPHPLFRSFIEAALRRKSPHK